ncbi:toll-like receptor 22 [Scyliorhinus canicula]|uniref:toll-like receptor 22 n=1 Tax=Scyliorhinus canicula TaxID=7830 RepID=UPI0018F78D45|nr:toll-like receptor 22 [Scyliorhinus canicula]
MHFTELLLVLISFHGDSGLRVMSFSLHDCQVHGSLLVGPNLKVLCYRMNLVKVPRYIPAATKYLDLAENRIASLQKPSFDHLLQLQNLNISQNSIRDIAEGTFGRTNNLSYLDLSYNQLTALTKGMLSGLGNLTKCLLNNNLIQSIEPDAFASLVNVKLINLNSNRLHRLEEMSGVFNAIAAKTLHIGDNGLVHFSTQNIPFVPKTLTELDVSKNPLALCNITTDVLGSLHSLDLSSVGGNGSVVLHVAAGSCLKGIKKLALGGIHMAPPEIRALLASIRNVSLEVIQLNNLQLQATDPLLLEICILHQNLRVLNLSGNSLNPLNGDGAFRPCVHLEHLDLSMNKLSSMSSSLFNHSVALRLLSLASNELTLVPAAVLGACSLESLDLSFNQIGRIDPQDFATLGKLKRLLLAGNKITRVAPSSFSGLFELVELQLGNNYLLEIANFSSDLKRLTTLSLRRNKLNFIQKHTFIHLQNLDCLNLIDNQISDLQEESFEGLSNLKHLLLGSNRLTAGILRGDIFSPVKSLKVLQLFDNCLAYPSSKKLDRAPFTSLKWLDHLAINSQAHNGLQHFPVNLLEGLDSLTELHAGNIVISHIDPNTFQYAPNISFLDLSNNAVKSIHFSLLLRLPALIELHLNKVGLQNLDFLKQARLINLKLLRAAGNQIGLVNPAHIKAMPSLTFLDLRENPFMCACDNSWFQNWSLSGNKTQVIYFDRYSCTYPPTLEGMKLVSFNSNSCLIHFEFLLYVSSSTVIIMTILVSFAYHFWRWHVVYAYYLFLALIYDRKRGRNERCKYDAFISYNAQDEQWVLNQLLPNLEGNNEWTLCLHHRDFEPGRPIIDNIVDNIYQSRKTICVISRHFLESEWCSREIQVASFRLFDERKDVLILVFLEDIPPDQLSPYHRMRKLVKKTTYLQWPQHQEERALFWLKLGTALKTAENRDESPLLSGTNSGL